jgi:hypothetical protein
MSFKGYAFLAGIIVAVSLPAAGHSPVSLDRQPPMAFQAGPADSGQPSAMTSQECIVFRSALQSVSAEPNGILSSARNVSRQIEPPIEQEKIASLPEPGSGVLLTLGLVAVIPLAGRRRTSRLRKAWQS